MHSGDSKELLLSQTTDADLELLRALGTLADERGTTAFVVGGVVRDLFHRPNDGDQGPHSYDLDVVVEADAVEFAEAAAERLGGAIKAHTRFGTVILTLHGGRKVDLATARSEVYERAGALPTVIPGAIENDLKRRDFTINSMAIVLNSDDFGTLLDPHGGRADLENRILRVLSDISFEDDPTRILRGVRFSARFSLSIEPVTEALLKRAVAERRTDTVSGERLLNEIELIIGEDDPWPPVFRLIDWGILSSMVEGWDVTNSVRATIVEIDRLLSGTEGVGEPAPARWMALFAALVLPLEPEVRERVVERLAAGRRIRALVRSLAEFEDDVLPALSADEELPPSRLHGLLRRFSSETLLVSRAAAPGTPVAERIALYTSELAGVSTALGGDDIAALGVPEGKAVGEILGSLLDARLDGDVSSEDDERELARRLAQSLTSAAETASVANDSKTVKREPEASEMAHEDLLEEQTTVTATQEPETATPEPARGDAPGTEAADVRDAEADAGAEAVAGTEARTGTEAVAGTGAEPAPEQEREAPLVHRPVYEVRLDAFEGPLDLLLHLIREHEIDIYDIPIASITGQYLEYINFMESLDLALAGEFLEMAATLIRIKVQMLLPKERGGDEEEEDPREQLVRKLVEYKQFKEVASTLSEKEAERRHYFPRGVDPKSYADTEEEEVDIEEFLRDVTLFDLVDGLREVLSRVPERVDVHSVDMEEFTVEELIGRIRNMVSERGLIPFSDVFGSTASRLEILATFIALLELIRLGEVKAIQKRNFGDIEIQARVEE